MRPSTALKRLPTAIDLFAGCGGLTLGLKQAGFRVLGAVEFDQLAAGTYEANHPEVRMWATDIRKLPVKTLMKALRLRRGSLSLLAGCPPCQGFSAVTTLNGKHRIHGPNNNLVNDFLRFVRVLRPNSIMLENVPALAANWRLARFQSKLRRMGYTCKVAVLDAQDYGVPQRRKRLILLASLMGQPRHASADPVSKTVRQAIGGLRAPGKTGDPCHDVVETRHRRTLKLFERIPTDGGSRVDAGARYQLACHRRISGFRDVYGRMAWDEVAPTVTGGCVNPSKGRFLHPEQNRAITLREAALLQGFPRDYYFSLARGKFATAQMIGNAFPPAFAARHATQLLAFQRKA